MTARYEIVFLVAAEHQPDVRDLADDVKEAILSAQRRGLHPNVAFAGGPTIAYVGAAA